DGERAERSAREPAAGADELVERRVYSRRIGRRDERLSIELAEPDDRHGPTRRIIRVEAHSTPEDAANLGGDGFRKRAVEPDEAVGDEGVDVGRAQRGRGGWKGGHGVLSNAPA